MSQSRPIRVLQLGSSSGLYGAERWILALLKHLPNSEIESIVASIMDSPGDRPALCMHAERLGFRTRVFEAHGKLSLAAIGGLRDVIRRDGIDVLHTHGYKTDVIGALSVRGTRCRIVSTPHGWTNGGVKLLLYEALDRLAFYSMDAVAPLSPDLFDGLSKLPGLRSRLHLIGNGVDLSEIDAVAAPSPDLAQWAGPADLVVGYIGQLVPRKRIDTLIRAFNELTVPNRRLCIIGDGPQRRELEKLAAAGGHSDRIRFFGYRDDRIALLKRLDVFVLPSVLEGVPRCVLEAMAAGVCVLASDIPACRVVIEHGVSGLLFSVRDTVGLARRLHDLLTDSALRSTLRQRAQALVRRDFSAEAMARRYVALYESLAAKNPGDADNAALGARRAA